MSGIYPSTELSQTRIFSPTILERVSVVSIKTITFWWRVDVPESIQFETSCVTQTTDTKVTTIGT